MISKRLIAFLLHVANAHPPVTRTAFYQLKCRLLRRYARFAGHQIQEIRKECWGEPDWRDDYAYKGCTGHGCPRCGGTGVFSIRWVRLERWEWCGRVFHCPSGSSIIPPSPYPPANMIRGLIEHKDYGRASREAACWLYLLCGEWRLLWSELTIGHYCHPRLWPMCRLQKIVSSIDWERSSRFRRRFWWLPNWRLWRICRLCPRDQQRTVDDRQIPF